MKKTLKRLSYHLHKEGLWIRLQRAYLGNGKASLSNSSYLVVDMGDITKQYASRMEGLHLVHDGRQSPALDGEPG